MLIEEFIKRNLIVVDLKLPYIQKEKLSEYSFWKKHNNNSMFDVEI